MFELLGKKTFRLPPKGVSIMSNWLTISEVLYSDRLKAEDVLNMLAYEITHNNRTMIVNRLFARYTKHLNKEMKAQFKKEVKLWESQKRTSKNI